MSAFYMSTRLVAGPSRLSAVSRLVSLSSKVSCESPLRPEGTQDSRLFSSTKCDLDKLKSHSGAKKRFFPTASGLWKRGQAGKQHLNSGFSASRINRLGKTAYTTTTQAKMLRKLLPHAS